MLRVSRPVSLRGAKRRSNPGVLGGERKDERLPRLLLAKRGEWLAMTGTDRVERQGVDDGVIG